MTDEELVQGMLEGRSLRTFMVPDPAMPTNHPEHMESFDLPHVIINGDRFWGKTENSHLAHHLGNEPYPVQAYCYTNMADIFCAYSLEKGKAGIMRKDRYKTHEWKLVRKHKLVWESDGDQPAEAVAKEIEAGAKFRIAMLDGEGIWNVHPVDLPMFETESGRFELRTVGDCYPAFFRSKTYLDDVIANIDNIDREELIPFETPKFECFYSFCSDGAYYDFYDIQRHTKKIYQRLKVFSDNLR